VALQPGLEDVLADLLEYEGDGQQGAEMYMAVVPEVDGGCCGRRRLAGWLVLLAGGKAHELAAVLAAGQL
jgi:hypothetical protein